MKSKNSHQGKKHIGNVLTQVWNTLLVAVLTLGSVSIVSTFSSCGGDSPSDYVEPVTPPTPAKNTPPTIETKLTEIDVTGGHELRISGNQLYIGSQLVASWSDKETTTCEVKLTLDGKEVKAGTSLTDEGTLILTVTDGSGESKSITVKLKITNGAPEIKLELTELNVFAGSEVSISDNKLLIGGEVVASWSDDRTEQCEVTLTLDGKEVKSGDVLGEAGKLTLTVTDAEEKSMTVEITLTNDSIYGLENLQQLNMQVDVEADLLQGISFADGIALVKVEVEIDGQRYEVTEPYHYTPDYPGTCNIIFTLKGTSGNTDEVVVENLTIKTLEYTLPSLEIADIINSHYPWFNNLSQWYIELGYDPSVLNNKKNFVYPHILTSYITGERYKWDNMEYIIVGEIPHDNYHCEDVGPNGSTGDDHADGSYNHIRNMTPFSHIKASGGCWNYVIDYISSHPEKLFMLSCASDALGGRTIHDLKEVGYSKYNALKQILEKENVIVCVAGFNNEEDVDKTLNENEKEQGKGMYKSASVNSEKNNKITVVGYNPADKNIFRDDHQSAMPVGFNNMKGNIVIPFTNLVAPNNSNLTGSTSSMPTGTLSSTLGNYLSIIMYNYPSTTLEDANTIMQQKYLGPETFKYKDENGNIKNGGTWYFFDTDKFLKSEILHETEIKQAFNNASSIILPTYPGLIYCGLGIFFTTGGTTYEMNEVNRAILETAVKAGSDIAWSYSCCPELLRKYGISGANTITIFFMDTKAQIVPDVSLTISIK